MSARRLLKAVVAGLAGMAIGNLVFLDEGSTGPTCLPVANSVEICDISDRWKPAPIVGDADIQFGTESGDNAHLSSGPAGTAEGLTLQDAADAVIAMLERNEAVSSFRLRGRHLIDSDATDSIVLAYSADVEGVPFVYVNTVVVGAKHHVQVVTWRIGEVVTSEGVGAHQEFLQAVKFEPDF